MLESLAAVMRPKTSSDVLLEIAKDNKVKYNGSDRLDLPKAGYSLVLKGSDIEVHVGAKKLDTIPFPEGGVMAHGFEEELNEVRATIASDRIQGLIKGANDVKPADVQVNPETVRPVPATAPILPEDIEDDETMIGGDPLRNKAQEAEAFKIGVEYGSGVAIPKLEQDIEDAYVRLKMRGAAQDAFVARIEYIGYKVTALIKERKRKAKIKPKPTLSPTPPKPTPTAAPVQPVAPTQTAPTPPRTNVKLEKFTAEKAPALPKAMLEAALAKQKTASRQTLIKKLRSRVIAFNKPIGNGQAGEMNIQMFPFSATLNMDKPLKTTTGITLTKRQIFSIMAGITADAPKGNAKIDANGVYDNVCRICGEQLEPVLVQKAGITFPSSATAHYKKHNVTMSWINKNVQDKQTGKIYAVEYIGTASEINDVI